MRPGAVGTQGSFVSLKRHQRSCPTYPNDQFCGKRLGWNSLEQFDGWDGTLFWFSLEKFRETCENVQNFAQTDHVLTRLCFEFGKAVWSDWGDASNRQLYVVVIFADQFLPPQINQVLSNSLEQLAS